jgi:hypothetical protein
MIKIRIRGVEEFQSYIRATVPRGAVRVALAAIIDWLIGSADRALRHYEPYKYVSRWAAYGAKAWTDKQRRWFWANGGPAMIGNNRTNETADAWTAKETNNGYGWTLSNSSAGAKHIWSNQQARQPALVGHRPAVEKIKTNIAGAIRHAQSKVNAFLKQKKG